jgi:hypothetical protein
MASIYENQVRASKTIFEKFNTTDIRYGLLRADVQSGKTGTYNHLIRLMFDNGLIDNAYVICGSHELELLTQCNNDRMEWHSHAEYIDRIHIVFRQHFDKTMMNTSRSLLIFDETHLVEKIDQTLCQFISKHGLTMAGTTADMITNSTYIVSVDATPFAEESAIAYDICLPKFRVVLENGDGYYGPQNYYEDGRIQPTYDLSTLKGKYNFTLLLRRFEKKYVLVRIREKRSKQIEWLKRWIGLVGCDTRYFTSHYDKAMTQIVVTRQEADEHFVEYGKRILSLEQEPMKTTVVFIDGRLRCGKRVPKKHIGCIWEASVMAKTDTIIQGLLGRMSGYIGDDLYNVPSEEDERPLIFIPERVLKRQERRKVIELSDLERYFIRSSDITNGAIICPRFGSNIIPGRIQNKPIREGHEVFQCSPVCFQLGQERTMSLSLSDEKDVKAWCLDELWSKMDLIKDNSLLTGEQRDEILLRLLEMSGEDCCLRRYRETSNQNMYNCHVKAYSDGVVSREHITDFPFLTFCVVHPDFIPGGEYKDTSIVPGQVYAIFYMKSRGKIEVLDRESRVSKVNRLTHFTT